LVTYLGHTPIYHKVGAIDKATFIAREKQHCLGLLNSFTESTGWEMNFSTISFRLIVTQPILE